MERNGGSGTSYIDQVNQSTWSGPRQLRAFDASDASPRSQWWSDAGERSAFLWVASEVRGQPMLDIGVGGGRTVAIGRLLTDDYVAIDYLPEMVERCRTNFPGIDVRTGDARDLSAFADGRFGFVAFTFNGLDGIDHADRGRALAEVHRVLRPGGLFLFSTHNKDGPVFASTPWRRQRTPQSWPWAYRALRLAGGAVVDPGHFPRSWRNWHRLRAFNVDGGEWGMSVVEAHDFGLVLHFTTFAGQVNQLDEIGFDLVTAFDAARGTPITPVTDTPYFQMVARKRVT